MTTATQPPTRRSRPLRERHISVIDIETTGLKASRDRIVELAIIRYSPGGQLAEVFCTLLDPEGPVGATDIHGISNNAVIGAPRFSDIVDAVTTRLQGTVVVAHNAAFDVPFLETEIERAGRVMPDVRRVCTLKAARTHLFENSNKLGSLCTKFGIDLTNAHSADADAIATGALLYKLLDIVEERGLGLIGDDDSYGTHIELDQLPVVTLRRRH